MWPVCSLGWELGLVKLVILGNRTRRAILLMLKETTEGHNISTKITSILLIQNIFLARSWTLFSVAEYTSYNLVYQCAINPTKPSISILFLINFVVCSSAIKSLNFQNSKWNRWVCNSQTLLTSLASCVSCDVTFSAAIKRIYMVQTYYNERYVNKLLKICPHLIHSCSQRGFL